jgi:hypothetical protein
MPSFSVTWRPFLKLILQALTGHSCPLSQDCPAQGSDLFKSSLLSSSVYHHIPSPKHAHSDKEAVGIWVSSAAVTKYHKLAGTPDSLVFWSHSSGDQKSQIKVSARLVTSEGCERRPILCVSSKFWRPRAFFCFHMALSHCFLVFWLLPGQDCIFPVSLHHFPSWSVCL